MKNFWIYKDNNGESWITDNKPIKDKNGRWRLKTKSMKIYYPYYVADMDKAIEFVSVDETKEIEHKMRIVEHYLFETNPDYIVEKLNDNGKWENEELVEVVIKRKEE